MTKQCRQNQVVNVMNSLRWWSMCIGWKNRPRDIEGQRAGWGLDNCLSFG